LEIDRAQAIDLALQAASPSDVVVIAGKGHEDYQEVAGVRHPFSDARVALAALQQRAQQGVRA
jgi:UDP-N-acetylmuramoyl-L-alanyl-D-glutamate--2,6-diaminopimelate ligase